MGQWRILERKDTALGIAGEETFIVRAIKRMTRIKLQIKPQFLSVCLCMSHEAWEADQKHPFSTP